VARGIGLEFKPQYHKKEKIPKFKPQYHQKKKKEKPEQVQRMRT
jgi:hypothetical protein